MSDPEVKSAIASRIRRGLEENDWPTAELARRSGVTEMQLGEILKEKAEPSIATLELIAKALAASIDEFFPPST